MDVRNTGTLLVAGMLSLVGSGCAATAIPTESAMATHPSPSAAPQAASSALQEGAWRIEGASSAAFTNRDVGGFEQTTIGVAASAGRMVSSNVLVEGIFEVSDSSTEADGGGEVDETDFLLGAAVRYYLSTEGDTHPYGRVLGGLAFVDVDFGGGVGDDDASPFLGFGLGAETFLAEHFALDYGFRFLYAFDIFDEELTEIALFIGLSIWL